MDNWIRIHGLFRFFPPTRLAVLGEEASEAGGSLRGAAEIKKGGDKA